MKENKHLKNIKKICISTFQFLHWKYEHKKGFTLAETLITLLIIGVVASLTIPSLIQSYKERETVTKLRKTYSVLQQAFKLADLDYGAPDTWATSNLPTQVGLISFFDKFIPYLKIQKNCQNKTEQCLTNDSYKIMNETTEWAGFLGTGNYETAVGSYKFLTQDNVSVIGIILDYKCNANWIIDNQNSCALILVDTNAQKSPNALGKDLFIFGVTKNSIIPWGGEGNSAKHNSYCKNSLSDGRGCARWVVERGNMDYLHKDTSW